MKNAGTSSKKQLPSVGFSVSARVAMQLGRESISNSKTAIVELVKNSFDADAENVSIKFLQTSPSSEPKPIRNPQDQIPDTLIIEDDGNGMSEASLKDDWMVIGTNNKALMRKSKIKRRILIGEKGLGRLGLDRLAGKTKLQSFTKASNNGVELQIEWKKYEVTSQRLEQIKHKLFRISKQSEISKKGEGPLTRHGTRLVLEELKDTWIDEDLKDLRNQLSLLVSPFAGINDFKISFPSSVSSEESEELSSQEVLDSAEWKLESSLDKNDTLHHKVSSRSGKEFAYSARWAEIFRSDSRSVPQTGPLSFQLYFYPRKSIDAMSMKRAELVDFLELNQGVRIYRDYFRVMPYGEPSGEGDWLGLALRRVRNPQGVVQKGMWVVGYNQIVGAIFLTREQNPALIDQTNREGIVEGPAYFDLRKFALNAIGFFEKTRQEYERSQKKENRYNEARAKAKDSSKSASSALTDFATKVSEAISATEKDVDVKLGGLRSTIEKHLNSVEAQLQESVQAQEELDEASEEKQKELEAQKDTLGNLASLGILATTFGHETLAYVNLVSNNIDLLKQNLNSLELALIPPALKAARDNVIDIEFSVNRIETFAKFALKNIRRDNRRKTEIQLDGIINEVLLVFSEELTQTRGIKIEKSFPKNLPTIRAFRIDWESIIVNLISNSIWALENTPRGERQIRIILLKQEKVVVLKFADSGIGIEKGIVDRIFQPAFSTKRNSKGTVIGTGMGLAIVDGFVQSYGGSIEVIPESDLGGAEFKITVPISV